MLVTPIHGLSTSQAPPFDETLLQGGATMSYTVFDGGARGSRIRRARESAAAADAALAASERDIVARVTTAYVDVHTRRQIVDAHDLRLDALRAELSRARQRFDAGRAPKVEVLRAEAALASAESERVRFAEALDFAERELARLTGARDDEARSARLVPIRLADSRQPPRSVLLQAALDASPALTRARAIVAAADAEVAIARSARWPEIKLSAGFYQRGSAGTRSWGEWAAGTALSFPLFTGGRTDAEVARTRAGRRGGEEALHLAEYQLAQELDRALSAVAEARARAASLAAATTRFAEVARIEKLALDAGTGTQTDYLIAEADHFAARASLAEATMSEIIARTEVARVTGQLNPAWVERVIASVP
jgi:outer membrane protein TolC